MPGAWARYWNVVGSLSLAATIVRAVVLAYERGFAAGVRASVNVKPCQRPQECPYDLFGGFSKVILYIIGVSGVGAVVYPFFRPYMDILLDSGVKTEKTS